MGRSTPPEDGPDPDVSPREDPPVAGADAAREALARARAAAREHGVASSSGRPGRPRRSTPQRSSSGPDARDPQLLGESVRRLVSDQGWSGPAAVAGVVSSWDQIVGPEVAAHVVPETFDVEQGNLVLRADSSAWASVLRLQLGQLSARVSEQVGPGIVRTISVLGPAAPSWKHGPRSVKGRGPRDTYG